MNSISIVVEGKLDVALLRKYLPALAGTPPRYFAGGGRVSLPTVARNLLVHESDSVVVVMDADILDPPRAEQQRAMVLAALRRVSEPARFDAFVFIPEHEIVFFEAPQVLQRYWDSGTLTPAVLDRGRYAPRRTLEELLEHSGQTRFSWLAALTPDDGAELRKGAQATHLVSMLCSLAGAEAFDKTA